MSSGRRLVVLVVALALAGAPAVVLRAFCVGKSCSQSGIAVTAPVPFCPLPADLRAQIVAGYRQGRSPDVMVATEGEGVSGGTDGSPAVAWPMDPFGPDQVRVPISLFGSGVHPGPLPPGTGLDQIAPTLARLMGYDRPHPEVRSGRPVVGVVAPGADPRLIVEIVWNAGTDLLSAADAPWTARTAFGADAASTRSGTTASLPSDPAATLTTIGTGGTPAQHGISGTLIRGPNGDVVPAWGPGAPTSIIATLADDWDHATNQRARIGIVAPLHTDLGLVGGNWYIDHDADDDAIGRPPVATVKHFIGSGYGADGTTDIIAVVLRGRGGVDDRTTRAIVRVVRARVPDTTFVVTASGSGLTQPAPVLASRIVARLNAAIGAPVVAAAIPGGLFLDQQVMGERGVTSDDVVRAMDAMKAPDGSSLFADAYPGFAVSFSRYC